jgi:hypothetical protein
VHVNTVIHAKDDYMVAGDEYKCTCCNDMSVKTRVYMRVKNVRIRQVEVKAKIGAL